MLVVIGIYTYYFDKIPNINNLDEHKVLIIPHCRMSHRAVVQSLFSMKNTKIKYTLDSLQFKNIEIIQKTYIKNEFL